MKHNAKKDWLFNLNGHVRERLKDLNKDSGDPRQKVEVLRRRGFKEPSMQFYIIN